MMGVVESWQLAVGSWQKEGKKVLRQDTATYLPKVPYSYSGERLKVTTDPGCAKRKGSYY